MDNTCIRIWLYNDPSCCRLLTAESEIFDGNPPNLVVEISEGKAFEYYYRMEAPDGYVGICCLLNEGDSPFDYSVKPNACDFPILFSPGGNPSIRSLGRSLRLLAGQTDEKTTIDVCLDMSLFSPLKAWLAGLGDIGILYDLGVSPESELLEIVDDLSTSSLLSEDTWLGLFCYGGLNSKMGVPDTTNSNLGVFDSLKSLPRSAYLHDY